MLRVVLRHENNVGKGNELLQIGVRSDFLQLHRNSRCFTQFLFFAHKLHHRLDLTKITAYNFYSEIKLYIFDMPSK